MASYQQGGQENWQNQLLRLDVVFYIFPVPPDLRFEILDISCNLRKTRDYFFNMFIVKSKILAIMLMLLISVGQTASAAEASCNMDINQVTMEQDRDVSCMKDMDMASQDRSGQDRSGQDRSGTATNDTTDCGNSSMAEYCNYNCHCPSGDVTSAILLATPDSGRDMAALRKNTKNPYLIIMQFPTALYRPPISL